MYGTGKCVLMFVPNFARIALPFTNPLINYEPTTFYRLNEDEKKTFDSLNQQLMDPTILELPQLKGSYTIATGAWNNQIGFVLLQQHTDGTTRPIGYW